MNCFFWNQWIINELFLLFFDQLRGTAKRSLQDLSRAINGDARSEPQPLFKVNVVLDKGTQKIELSPTIITLTQMVNVISKKLLMVLKKVQRLFHPQKSRLGYNEHQASEVSTEDGGEPNDDNGGKQNGEEKNPEEEGDDAASPPQTPSAAAVTLTPIKSYYDIVSEDEDVLKVLVNIMNGMSSSGPQLNKVLGQWDEYRLLWEMDREAFIRRYV